MWATERDRYGDFGGTVFHMTDNSLMYQDFFDGRPGFFTYHDFVTITTSSRIISRDSSRT
jgi:hypothetical protein